MSGNHGEESKYLGFLAGSVAGLIGDLCVHPVDTIRTRLQAQRKEVYSGMIDAFRKTVRSEGLGGLFKGFGAVGAMTMPAHALYFGGYEGAKMWLQRERREEEKSAWVYFVSGFVADIFGSLIWTPMDVIKQRVQIHHSSSFSSPLSPHSTGFNSSWLAFKGILASDGFFGLYRGLPVALATFGPYVGLYFTFYEQLKWSLHSHYQNILAGHENQKNNNSHPHSPSHPPSTLLNHSNPTPQTASPLSHTSSQPKSLSLLPLNLVCAFLAASFAALLTCPIDVVKTNMQVYSVKEGGQTTTIEVVKALYRDSLQRQRHETQSLKEKAGNGKVIEIKEWKLQLKAWKVFFRGWNARILWLAPGSAITMAAYEQCKNAVSFLYGSK